MKKLIGGLIILADALMPYAICLFSLIDAVLHVSRLGPAMTGVRLLVVSISWLALHFCIMQIISIKWPRTFDISEILNAHHLMIEYGDLLEGDDGSNSKKEETDCAELDIVLDEEYFEEPLLCCCLLYDKHLGRIQQICCPVYTNETEREIRHIDATKGIRRYYKLLGMEDVEGYENMEIDEETLKILVRSIMSTRRKDSKESARLAYDYILETSDGFLPRFALGRRGAFKSIPINQDLNDYK